MVLGVGRPATYSSSERDFTSPSVLKKRFWIEFTAGSCCLLAFEDVLSAGPVVSDKRATVTHVSPMAAWPFCLRPSWLYFSDFNPKAYDGLLGASELVLLEVCMFVLVTEFAENLLLPVSLHPRSSHHGPANHLCSRVQRCPLFWVISTVPHMLVWCINRLWVLFTLSLSHSHPGGGPAWWAMGLRAP